MIYTGCIPQIDSSKYNEVWWIVRSPEKTPTTEKLIQELSPSKKLFKAYRKAFHLGIFDETLTDLAKNQKALERLEWLCQNSKRQDIILGCYCKEEKLCHRSIIAGILLGMEAEINTKKEYIRYFETFKRGCRTK